MTETDHLTLRRRARRAAVAGASALTAVVALLSGAAPVTAAPAPGGPARADVDIVSMTAADAGDRLTFQFRVRDLGSSGVFIAHWHGLEVPGNPDSASEQMAVVDHRNGRTRVTLWSAIEIWRKIGCRGMTSSWQASRNTVRVSVPRSCVYFQDQTLNVDGHAAYSFPYGADDLHIDGFPANKPDKTKHFGLAVS